MSRQLAVKVAWCFLGKPYIWGGDDPVKGFDCSGFCIEILKSVGMLPRKGDWTASGLYQYFADRKVADPYEGCLAFWDNGRGKVIHVEFCLSNSVTIGASGGGSAILTEQDAVSHNAYVKVRPLRLMRLKGFVDPFHLKQ